MLNIEAVQRFIKNGDIEVNTTNVATKPRNNKATEKSKIYLFIILSNSPKRTDSMIVMKKPIIPHQGRKSYISLPCLKQVSCNIAELGLRFLFT